MSAIFRMISPLLLVLVALAVFPKALPSPVDPAKDLDAKASDIPEAVLLPLSLHEKNQIKKRQKQARLSFAKRGKTATQAGDRRRLLRLKHGKKYLEK